MIVNIHVLPLKPHHTNVTILLVKKAHTSRKVNLSTSSKNKNKNIFEKISKSISK
jgi:hypothetical protein